MYERNIWIRGCSDEELLDDALQRAFPPVDQSDQRFALLLEKLRELETSLEDAE